MPTPIPPPPAANPPRRAPASVAASVAALLVVLALPIGGPARAADAPAKADGDARALIAKKFGVKPDGIRASPVAGVYEVVHGAEIMYITADARFVLDGDLIDVDQRRNVTEARRSEARAGALADLAAGDVIEFGPKSARYTVTVFTDVDCGYCRQLHSEIAEYNRLGIRVRYAFYPRTGPNTESWRKAEAVWCAPNRQDALTKAKRGEVPPTPPNCKATPVAKTYELGREMRVRGTPGIFTDRGEYVAGYLPPDRLLARLKELEKGGAGSAASAASAD